jgi:hypothetical protein
MTLTTIEDISKIVAFGGDDTDETGIDGTEEEKELGLEDDDLKEDDPEKESEEPDEDDVEEE